MVLLLLINFVFQPVPLFESEYQTHGQLLTARLKLQQT